MNQKVNSKSVVPPPPPDDKDKKFEEKEDKVGKEDSVAKEDIGTGQQLGTAEDGAVERVVLPPVNPPLEEEGGRMGQPRFSDQRLSGIRSNFERGYFSRPPISAADPEEGGILGQLGARNVALPPVEPLATVSVPPISAPDQEIGRLPTTGAVGRRAPGQNFELEGQGQEMGAVTSQEMRSIPPREAVTNEAGGMGEFTVERQIPGTLARRGGNVLTGRVMTGRYLPVSNQTLSPAEVALANRQMTAAEAMQNANIWGGQRMHEFFNPSRGGIRALPSRGASAVEGGLGRGGIRSLARFRVGPWQSVGGRVNSSWMSNGMRGALGRVTGSSATADIAGARNVAQMTSGGFGAVEGQGAQAQEMANVAEGEGFGEVAAEGAAAGAAAEGEGAQLFEEVVAAF